MLGKGPAIFIFDGSMIPNNQFVEWVLKLARRASSRSSSSRSRATARTRAAAEVGEGIPAVNLGVPTRYGHSQSGVIDRADYDGMVKLWWP